MFEYFFDHYDLALFSFLSWYCVPAIIQEN